MQLVICLPSDDRHYQETSISYIHVYDLDSKIHKGYSIYLVDKEREEIPKFDGDIIVFNKKLFDRYYPNNRSFDMETQSWIQQGESFYKSKNYQNFYSLAYFWKGHEDNRKYIPYLKYREYCEDIITDFLKVGGALTIDKASLFYSDNVYPCLSAIEGNGLYVDLDLFNSNFEKSYKSNIVHTLYNLHTSTGRPSNAFDGINFSALNKTDDTRKSIVSRFEKGILVEFDFNAYHLRIIAKLMKYDFCGENIHEYLAKQYYNIEDITEELYNKSKLLTFRYLYGSVDKEHEDIPFFVEVRKYKDSLWKRYITDGYIDLPISKRKLFCKEPTKSKLFNYLLQGVETECSIIFIRDILRILKDKKSKLVLYTYDSFLIDFDMTDGKESLIDIKNYLGGVSMKIGSNYRDLEYFEV